MAQPPADFTVKPLACIGQSLEITNFSADAVGYQWDFCLDDIRNFKQSKKILTLAGLSSGTNYKLVEANGLWFAFVTSYQNNKIYRLDFGDNINNIPSVTDLGNFGGLILEPYSIDVSFHNGEWFGFVSSLLVNHGVVKLRFSNALTNAPAASNLGNFGFSTNYIDLQIIYQDGDALLALVANGVLQSGDGSLVTVNFKNSFDNVPSSEDIFSARVFGGGNTLRGFDLIKKNGNWIGFYSVSGGSKIVKLTFGSNVQTAPVSNVTLTFDGVGSPFEINILQEGSKYFGIVSNLSLQIAFIDFGTLEGETPVEMSTPVLPSLFSATIVRHDGKTLIQGASLSNEIHHIVFEAPCSSTVPFSSDITPPIFNFTSSGIKEIELIARWESEYSVVAKAVDILSFSSPDIAFTANGFVCAGTPVTFTAESSAGDITDYSWSYGDATIGLGIISQHAYSPGNYEVRLEVTATNGCKNEATQNLKIYHVPVADFVVPSGLLCTNNEFAFATATPDIYDGNLTYEWFVDNNPVSTDRDLDYTFTTTGSKNIKLVTEIPGCASEITQSTPQVEAGPVVDFTFSGTCEDDLFSFENLIADPVDTYLWDFGAGATSDQPDPSHTFSGYGDREVSLTATNTIGCETVVAKTVAVRSKPEIDFMAEEPPNACTGTPTQFENQTTNPDSRDVVAWSWDFDDPANPEEQTGRDPEHVFELADSYSVRLTATTADGCSDTFEKVIEIHPSPLSTFTYTSPCVSVPVVFTGPADPSITEHYWEIGTSYYETPSPTHAFQSAGIRTVFLQVTSGNGCVSTHSEILDVPGVLVPDFSITKNCLGQTAILSDLTTGPDPVVAREWSVDGSAPVTDSPLRYTFNEQGNSNVTLTVFSAGGCTYNISKTVPIHDSPVAAFLASPQTGAYPLAVNFINESSLATRYLWEFIDGTGSVSTQESPAYIFQQEGSFDVRLTAYNAQDCESTHIEEVTTLAPLPDVDVQMITLAPNPDGSTKLIVTIHNKGNTVLTDLPLEFNFSGSLLLREILDVSVPPNTHYNFVLSPGLVDAEMLRYLCVTLDLEDDLSPEGNRLCEEFENKLFVFPAFPNPASETLSLEWISTDGAGVRLSLTDALGRTIYKEDVESSSGLNRRNLDLRGLRDGMYILAIEDGTTKTAQRVILSDRP